MCVSAVQRAINGIILDDLALDAIIAPSDYDRLDNGRKMELDSLADIKAVMLDCCDVMNELIDDGMVLIGMKPEDFPALDAKELDLYSRESNQWDFN